MNDDDFRLLSRSGPEVPPDVAAVAEAVYEPTQKLAYVEPRIAPVVAGRTVIVYENRPRRPWRLWAFTAVLVALTLGVVLGQAVAYQPPARSAARPTPVDVVTPVVVAPISEPLGRARTRVLEISGSATNLRIRSLDLGSTLYTVTPLDASTAPRLVRAPAGPRLTLSPTGAPGTLGATVLLTSRVRWTIRVLSAVPDSSVDMAAGGLAAISLAGGSRAVLSLPRPAGSVPVAVTGPVGSLEVRAPAAVPVRLRLTGGAGQAGIGGKPVKAPKPGTVLSAGKWAAAKNRYDVTTAAGANVVRVDPS